MNRLAHKTCSGGFVLLLSLVTQTSAQPPQAVAPTAENAPAPLGHRPMTQVTGLKLSPDGKFLVTSVLRSVGGKIVSDDLNLWDVGTAQRLFTIAGKGHPDVSIVFSPDGTRLATVGFAVPANGGGRRVSLWAVPAGKLVRTLDLPTDAFGLTLAWSPDGATIAGGTATVAQGKFASQERLWDVATGKLHQTGEAWQGQVNVAFGPGGQLLATTHWLVRGDTVDGSEVALSDATTGTPQLAFQLDHVAITQVCFSPDGASLATLGDNIGEGGRVEESDVRLWDAATGALKWALPHVPEQRVEHLFFSPDGKTLGGGGTGLDGAGSAGYVWWWDTQTGQLKSTLNLKRTFEDGEMLQVPTDLTPDGKAIAVGMANGAVQLVDSATGAPLRTFAEVLTPALPGAPALSRR